MTDRPNVISKFSIIGNESDKNGVICYAIFTKNIYSKKCFNINLFEIDKFGTIREFSSNDCKYKEIIYDKIVECDCIDDNTREMFTKTTSYENSMNEILRAVANSKSLSKGGTVNGLLDSFIINYSKFHLNTDINPYNLSDISCNSNNDILLKHSCHYSSLPIININGQRYLFDTLGDKHQDKNGKIIDEISTKFPGIKPLNPFGLDYQNDSNACGIWSANILKQVNEFKKNGKENEIIKTYFYKDIGSYTVLNPEILFLAAVQVSKDLTPETKKPELKILNEGEEPEEGYVKVKIGNTIFSMDTAYRPESCIDIQTLALSIPEVELINNIEINKDFIKKQKEILENLEQLDQNSRRNRINEIFNFFFSNRSRNECLKEGLIGREYVKARLKALNSRKVQNVLTKSLEKKEKPNIKPNIINFP